MTGHVPFDSKSDWANPYCGNQSNDPLVDKLIGNAYHVVRTVYCNLGNLKLIYDFLQQYGMVLGVQSEAELKAMTVSASYVRLYGFDNTNKRTVTDYLYVEGDRTGVIPDDTTATGSWIIVASSTADTPSGDVNNTGYLVWLYNDGSATGGETTIVVPEETVGIPFITVGGFVQVVGKGFTYDAATHVITLAQELEAGDEVICFLTGIPATPDTFSVDNWKVINWLYNHGAAVGGEQVIDIPFIFQDVPAVYKNGSRLYKDLPDNSYTIDAPNKRIFLTEAAVTNDRFILTIGGNIETVYASDRTIQEVARGFNLPDSSVVLSTDTTSTLNGKVVVYVVNQQTSYKLPSLPTNVHIGTIVGDQLTYTPGNVTVTLLPITIL